MMMKTALEVAAVSAAAVLCPPAAGVITVGGMILTAEGCAGVARAINEFDGDSLECAQDDEE